MSRKVGLHGQEYTGNALESILRARPPVFKTMSNNVDAMRQIMDNRSDTIVVLRRFFDSQTDWMNKREAGGREVAKMVIGHFSGVMLSSLLQAQVYVEGLNEVGLWEDAAAYTSFTVGFAQECKQQGVRPAVYSFSTGTPTGDQMPDGSINLARHWKIYEPGLDAAIDANGALAKHEYSWPTMQDQNTWQCFRYRRDYAVFPKRLKKLQLLITETGIDKGVVEGIPDAPNNAGWRAGNQSEEQYASQLAWYDAGLSEDGYVLGATIFTCGGYWPSFDVAGVWPVIDWIAKQEETMPLSETKMTLIRGQELYSNQMNAVIIEASGVDEGVYTLIVNADAKPDGSAYMTDAVVFGALGDNPQAPNHNRIRNGRNAIMVPVGKVDATGPIGATLRVNVGEAEAGDPPKFERGEPINERIKIIPQNGQPMPAPEQPSSVPVPAEYDDIFRLAGDLSVYSAWDEDIAVRIHKLIQWRKGELAADPFPPARR